MQEQKWFPPLPLVNDGIGRIYGPIVSDPDGRNTGRPRDREDWPVQDADDL